jgi:hypothetical protein
MKQTDPEAIMAILRVIYTSIPTEDHSDLERQIIMDELHPKSPWDRWNIQ